MTFAASREVHLVIMLAINVVSDAALVSTPTCSSVTVYVLSPMSSVI